MIIASVFWTGITVVVSQRRPTSGIKGKVWWTAGIRYVRPKCSDVARFQIMHSWNTCCEVRTHSTSKCEVFLQLYRHVYIYYSSAKDVYSFVTIFKTLIATLLKQWCNVSCDKILQCDWTAPYCAVGHCLYTQFTRPLIPFLWKWVWLARLFLSMVRHFPL